MTQSFISWAQLASSESWRENSHNALRQIIRVSRASHEMPPKVTIKSRQNARTGTDTQIVSIQTRYDDSKMYYVHLVIC